MKSNRQAHAHLKRLAATGNTLLLLALIVLAGCATQVTPAPSLQNLTTSALPLPTRAPAPTALPAQFYLEQFRLELLQAGDDLSRAEALWNAALEIAPNDSEVQREGARLAWRQNALEVAAERANTALRLDPEDAEAWLLAGAIAEKLGDLETAQTALRTAETLKPALAESLFPTQWRIAIETGNKEALSQLAQSYLVTHFDDPYAVYYRAEALLATDYAPLALELLSLRMDTDSDAVLWYTLGRIYLAVGDPQNAIIALETASTLLARGDQSLVLASADPLRDVNLALGRAYLRVQRCEEALSLVQLLATPYPEAATLVQEAQQCTAPAPTPTFAPWMP
jgi:Flp pilus assembly protein TadD